MSHAITEKQHAVLVHCLGLDNNPRRDRKPYRNYYCVEPDQDGYEMVDDLRKLGYLEREKGGCFRATRAGIAVARLDYEAYLELVEIVAAPGLAVGDGDG